MMQNQVVRIEKLTLNSFKNVCHGTFTMPSFLRKKPDCSDILGIYGQNGSGKTAVIEAFQVLDSLFSGEPLPEEIRNYINVDTESAELILGLMIGDTPEKGDMYTYTVSFSRDGKTARIDKETLSAKTLKADGSYEREKVLIEWNRKEMKLTPESTVKKMTRLDKTLELDLAVAMKIAEKSNTSFIFSTDGGWEVLTRLPGEYRKSHSEPIRKIREYALSSLMVFSLKDSGIASDTMTLTYSRNGVRERMEIDLMKPALVTKAKRRILDSLIREMNTVLSAIVPHLTLGIIETNEELDEEGEKGVRVEIVSLKNNRAIPLRYESEGIIKIISIINVLLSVYNSPSVCLVIDEFDASIFEYLLGEIISVFSRGAQGQMIFTSHNLRILEMINKDSVIFSTTNPENRYIRMSNIKSTNNLRDVYIRSILLGGTEEDIYEETDSHDIGRALRKAWRQDGE